MIDFQLTNELINNDVFSDGQNANPSPNKSPKKTKTKNHPKPKAKPKTSQPPKKEPVIKYKTKPQKVTKPKMIPNQLVKFLYLNARSANNKLDVLRSLAQDVHQAKILLITETWFNNASKMKIDNFNLVTHKNRTLNKASGAGVGGGVAIYVHQSIAHDCFEIKTKCKSKLQQTVAASICGQVFVLTYRSPSTESMKGNRKRDVLQTMQNDWYELKPGSANPIWIGDFNCPKIDFKNQVCNDEHHMGIFEAINSHGLDQIIEEPTHRGGNCLDLLFIGSETMLANHKVEERSEDQDHHAITGEILVNVPEVDLDYCKEVFVHADGDMDKFNAILENTDWNFILNNPSSDIALEKYIEAYINAYKESVPTRKIFPKRDRQNQYKKDTIAAIEKAKALKDAKHKAYRVAQGRANKLIRRDNFEAKKKVLRKMENQKKILYNEISDSTNDSESEVIGPLYKDDNKKELTKSTTEVLDIMRKFLSSVFRPQKESNIDWSKPKDASKPQFKKVRFTPEKVKRSIQKIPGKCATGPDGVTVQMVKKSARTMCNPLSKLFNRFQNEGYCPKLWRISRVRLLKKPGERTNPSNHRPIAVGNILEKVFSRIAINEFTGFLLYNDLIDEKQYGFLPGVQLVENILTFEKKVVDALDNDKPVTAVYLDIAKCFDTVPHHGLMESLYEAGVSGKIGQFWQSYYYNYSQYIVIDEEESEEYKVSSGVIQGSVGGPIHFLVFYNSILQACKSSEALAFADDIKVFRITENEKDFKELEDDIDRINQQMKIKELDFNVKKSLVFYMGNRNKKLPIHMGDDKEVVSETDEIRDLGVFYSKNKRRILSKKHHIQTIVSKINARTGLIRKHFKYLNFRHYCFLYKTYILPYYLFAKEFFIDEEDQVSLKQLNDAFPRFFHDVRIPRDEDITAYFPRNPVEMALASVDFFFWRYVWGNFRGIDPRFIEKVPETERKSTRFKSDMSLKLPIPKKNVLKSSFFYQRSKIWNTYREEEHHDLMKFKTKSSQRIDEKFPFIRESSEKIMSGHYEDHSRNLRQKFATYKRKARRNGH